MRGAMVAVLCFAASGCSFDRSGIQRAPDGAPSDAAAPDAAAPEDLPWWDEAFSHRNAIVFDNRGREALLEVPVPIALDATRFAYDAARADGADLRFVDGDGQTALAHEIERWDPLGTSHVWVRVPRIDGDSAADFVHVYYGNATAAPGHDPAGVWSVSGHIGVYHLSDQLTLGPDTIRDSSGSNHHGHDGVFGTLSSDQRAAGLIGGAVEFTSLADRVDVDEPSFGVGAGQTRTMEVWFNAPQRDTLRQMWFMEWNCRGWALSLTEDGFLAATFAVTDNPTNGCAAGSFDIVRLQSPPGRRFDDAQWHGAAFVVDRVTGTGRLYADGALADEQPIDTTRLGTAQFGARIGHSFDAGATFIGRIDETRISEGVRSPDWIAGQHAALAGDFAIVGPIERGDGS